MWRVYFPCTRILGVDNDPSPLFSDRRTGTDLLDQTDPDTVRKFWSTTGDGPVELSIDDGLHTFDAARCLLEGS
jgi:hypothetical protein